MAPVSLLENWKQEIDKFFEPGTLPVLTLYGPTLREKRLPRAAIQEELLRAGIADYFPWLARECESGTHDIRDA